ncbi:MAG: hypothetical protein EZS28_035171, partial [Streblomastix strix]
GIEQVCKGYKYELNAEQQLIGEVKIEGFASNFASYLNCLSLEGQNCLNLLCDQRLDHVLDQCKYEEEEEEEKKKRMKEIIIIVGIVSGILVMISVIIVIIVAIIISRKIKFRKETSLNNAELLAPILRPLRFSQRRDPEFELERMSQIQGEFYG